MRVNAAGNVHNGSKRENNERALRQPGGGGLQQVQVSARFVGLDHTLENS